MINKKSSDGVITNLLDSYINVIAPPKFWNHLQLNTRNYQFHKKRKRRRLTLVSLMFVRLQWILKWPNLVASFLLSGNVNWDERKERFGAAEKLKESLWGRMGEGKVKAMKGKEGWYFCWLSGDFGGFNPLLATKSLSGSLRLVFVWIWFHND